MHSIWHCERVYCRIMAAMQSCWFISNPVTLFTEVSLLLSERRGKTHTHTHTHPMLLQASLRTSAEAGSRPAKSRRDCKLESCDLQPLVICFHSQNIRRMLHPSPGVWRGREEVFSSWLWLVPVGTHSPSASSQHGLRTAACPSPCQGVAGLQASATT